MAIPLTFKGDTLATTQLGVALSFLWGTQRVGEFFLPPGQKKSFSVGSAAGVDFVMGHSRLGSPSLEVLRTDGLTHSICFTKKMRGELIRGSEPLSLEALIDSGKATHEGSCYTLELEAGDVLWTDLGGVTMEVSFQSAPKRVHVPLADSVDYRALNIFVVLFFISALFVISALNRSGEDDSFADELTSSQTRLTKLVVKPPEPQKNHFLQKLAKQKPAVAQPSKPLKPLPKPPRKPSPHITDPSTKAQAIMKSLFRGPGKGVSTLFGAAGLNIELKSAITNVTASAGTPGSLAGLVTRSGPGGPGGPGNTVGIGALGTLGRAGGDTHYGRTSGSLTGKQTVDVGLTSSEPEIKNGSLDKELVRKVIQDHKQQIRACFESLLNQYPDLNGKVQTQFTIGAEGQVLQSSVSQSSTGSKELDSCVARHVRLWEFPKPKGGGTVLVSYPFIFKQSGR